MSDQTIALWGKILQAVPDAILVLKANALRISTPKIFENECWSKVLTLIVWSGFPRQRSLEHLQQYSKLDVALDPCPNGGCTTM